MKNVDSLIWQNAGVIVWLKAGTTIWQNADNSFILYCVAQNDLVRLYFVW